MQYNLLQNSNIKISNLGLGCASFWANKLYSFENARKIVDTAINNGVNYFDTGHSYAEGSAEIRLGNIIKNYPRDSLVISTKVGSYHKDGKILLNFEYDFLEKQLDESLKVLHLDYIDILYLHGPNELNEDMIKFLHLAKEKGKLRLGGINSFNSNVINECIKLDFIDVYMLDYNIVNPLKIKHFNDIKVKGRDIIAAAPLASNYIDKKFLRINSIASFWYILRAYLIRKLELEKAKKLQKFFDKYPEFTPQSIALKFVINNPNITSSVIGTTKEKHLLENIESCNINLPEELILKFIEIENEYKLENMVNSGMPYGVCHDNV